MSYDLMKVTKFSIEEVSRTNKYKKFVEAVRKEYFVEIMDCSKIEALELVKEYVSENLPHCRMVHLGDNNEFRRVFERTGVAFLEYELNIANNPKEVQRIVKFRPDIFLIRHSFINYMERDYLKEIAMIGHVIIFY